MQTSVAVSAVSGSSNANVMAWIVLQDSCAQRPLKVISPFQWKEKCMPSVSDFNVCLKKVLSLSEHSLKSIRESQPVLSNLPILDTWEGVLQVVGLCEAELFSQE